VKLRVTPAAEEELVKAAVWYDDQKSGFGKPR